MTSQPGTFPQLCQRLRTLAKDIGPLYWLAGALRYVAFLARLREENRLHAARGSSLPPPMLRYRVHGALDESSYVSVGREVARTLFDALRRRGIEWEGKDVLDFACGPGRVAAELKKLAPACGLQGSDIDGEAIAWAQWHLRAVGTFHANEPVPPTRFPDGRFDVIYSVSLFTHLDERAQDLWLHELARILKPGGTFATTVHGRLAMRSCSDAELRVLAQRGIAYRVDRKGRFKLDGLPDFYQTTFHTREYVERTWTRELEIVDYVEGGLGGHQDLVVMRRRER
jgi:SAM-dependent methyltransferase